MDLYFSLVTVATTIFMFFLGTIFYMFYEKFRVHENQITELSLPRNWIHDVFPSFHGADVRRSFLSHIIKEFRSKGINPFIDNEINRGEFIGPALKKAIQESRIAIVLLSKNYASSSWCLDELVEIMKCKKDLGQTVIAIFYEVDPSDIKKQAGDFGKVFKKTCKGKKNEVIRKWRQALVQVATIAGYHSRNWDNEAAMIEDIATDVSNKLFNSTSSRDFDGFIGMGAHMERMDLLLRQDLDEVRMIGIWGPPGIGKSTIARFLFNHHSHKFQLSVFMEDIKAMSSRAICSNNYSKKLDLQQKFISQIINQKDVKITHLGVAKERLGDKKVLAVLDDVDRLVQLEAMAKETCWFGRGSRVIIITQDRKLLRAHRVNHIYKVDFPSTDEALKIFCTYAFGQKYPQDGFEELARKIASLAGELPLGLEVLGSYLRGMSKDEWLMELPRLRTSLNREIENVLKYSYDALYDEDKDLFLYIANFFHYGEIEKVVEHLSNKFSNVRRGLDVLIDKSLIYMEKGLIRMHDLLLQLGRDIARKQYVLEPRQRQFLVDNQEICEVLIGDTTGSRNVIGINLEFEFGTELYISGRAFEGMANLQFLRLKDGLGLDYTCHLSHGLSYLSPKLRLLHWDYFPLTCLPSNINLEFLVELNMCESSKLEKLWEGIKHLPNLKWMNLSSSKNLKELPNLSTARKLRELKLASCSSLVRVPFSIGNATNLEKLDLKYCSSLVELPSSIENATNLKKLDLSFCKSLVEIPSSIGNATSLQELLLNRCSSLVELPSSIGNATNLKKLDLNNCRCLVEIPYSIGNATKLQTLNLGGCSSLKEIPSSIGNATKLQTLNLIGCSSLKEIPSSIGNATNLLELDLRFCSSLVELPSSIENASNLQNLNLRFCSSLVELPSSIGNATNLQILNLSCCSSLVELPSSIGNATNLQRIDLSYCSSLVELPSSIWNATSLERLDLSYCTSMVELPSSIGNATSLQELDLKGCSSLMELPSSIFNATSLKRLDISYCTSLDELPSYICNATSLERLDISYSTSLVKLPSFIGNATNIQELDLKGCSSLMKLPSSIFNATSLERLDISYCTSLVKLPSSIGNTTNLQEIDLKGCSSLMELPSSIGNATNLERLDLSYCTSLVELPSSIGNTTNLQEINLKGCLSLMEIPSSIGNATNLERLDLSYCSRLMELPSSIGNATNLHKLDLKGCSSLVKLPFSTRNIKTYLDLEGCSSLLEIPSFPANAINLKGLNLSGCSSLVEVPTFIGNLHKLRSLSLRGCSKLEVLPVNVNLKSLEKLDLSGCSSLKSFPEISTNITDLDLSGTAIEEVPASIWSWSYLDTLDMSYCKNLKEFSRVLDNITYSDTKIQEFSPLVQEFSFLCRLILKGCKELLSLPQLPYSLSELDAENCQSLERLDCSFQKSDIRLNFVNCFKLNQEARDLIIQTSTCEVTVLPGKEIPTYFTHRANRASLIVKLNENPFLSHLKFKACILLVENDIEDGYEENEVEDSDVENDIEDGFEENDVEDSDEENEVEDSNEENDIEDSEVEDGLEENDVEDSDEENKTEDSDEDSEVEDSDEENDNEDADGIYVRYGIIDKENSLDVQCSSYSQYLSIPFTEHLYVFEFEADVISNELFFEFTLTSKNNGSIDSRDWVIKECGVQTSIQKKESLFMLTLKR